MREVANAERIRRFMRALAADSRVEARVYFTGGATAVLLGWRTATIDVDVKFVPEHDTLLRAIPALKETLRLNVELASPGDFIPVASGWEDRSLFIAQERQLSFYHFDPYAQALAKIERGLAQDLDDVREMIRRGLVEPDRCLQYFEAIREELYRYPAVDPRSFQRAIKELLGSAT